MNGALRVEDLRIATDDRVLIEGVSLAAGAGEALTILGESGSGKSLISHAIMGTLPAGLRATGEITVAGDVSSADSDRRRRLWGRSIALLPQEPWRSLDPTMRALRQVAETYPASRDAGLRHANAVLDALRVGPARHRYPFMLSGGLAQRVAYAATSATGAELMIVDEPTKGLDAAMRDQLAAMLAEVPASGRTLLTITHDVHVARALGGRIMVMLRGRIVEEGAAADVLDRPAHAYTRRLIAADPQSWPVRPSPPPGAPLVVGHDLSHRYADHRLFSHVHVAIGRGERAAIVGASGSGKTTLGNILLGLTAPASGRVERAAGLPATSFQKLYQDPPAAFPPKVTLRQSLRDLTLRLGMGWTMVETLLSRLSLAPFLLDRRPDQVSGGELQRIALLRILLIEPALIFADEATSRLDPIMQQETIDLLVEHTEQRGCALLMVTHDEALARNICGDRKILLG